jgi:multiple sugar transport system substrate-binding protein
LGSARPTDAPETAEPTEPPATSDKIQIRWFVGLGTGTDPAQLPAQEKAAADFNASQDEIELVVEVVPFDSARDTLSTQIASGAGPDIIGPVGWGGSNAFYGQWLDMTPYIESTGFDTSVYDPALIEFYQTEEGQVGLPFLVFPAAIYYVPAMFDEAGLAYPPAAYGEKYTLDGEEVDWNWETLTEVAKRLTVDVNGVNATEDGFDATQLLQVGFANQWQTHVAYQASYIAGAADIVEGEEGNYTSAMPDSWKEANKLIYDGMWGEQPFMATGPLAGAPEFGNGNLFNSGKAAMAMTPLWYTCCLDDFTKAGNEFQAGVLPVGADGKPHGRVDADTIRLWKGSAHPEEAFKALSYLIGPEGIQTLVVGTEEVPAA